MCGIIVKKDSPFTLSELISIYDEEQESFLQRGDDSLGIFCLNIETGDYETFKLSSVNSEDNLMKFLHFLDTKYEELETKYNLFIYHNRWASVGGKSDELAHPIIEEDWIVIHNGTKTGADLLTSKSDSQGFARYILDSRKIRRGFLDGSGVIFAYQIKTNRLYFHKDGTRSLFANESANILSSEPLSFKSEEWFPVDDIGFDLFANIKVYQTTDSKELISLKKVPPKVNCDCCKKRSSNCVEIGKETICYNCLSNKRFDNKDLSKKDVTSYVYDEDYWNGKYANHNYKRGY